MWNNPPATMSIEPFKSLPTPNLKCEFSSVLYREMRLSAPDPLLAGLQLGAEEQRYLDRVMRDYRRKGMHLEEAKRKEVCVARAVHSHHGRMDSCGARCWN